MDEIIKLVHADKASGVWVILRPQLLKFVECIRLNRQLKVVSLAQESVNYDRHEQVDEDLSDQNLEQDEEGVRDNWTAALVWNSAIGHHTLVSLFFNTLVHLGERSGQVKHNQVP